MKIESLKDKPQFIEIVSGWIYKEFIENIRHGVTYEKIVGRV